MNQNNTGVSPKILNVHKNSHSHAFLSSIAVAPVGLHTTAAYPPATEAGHQAWRQGRAAFRAAWQQARSAQPHKKPHQRFSQPWRSRAQGGKRTELGVADASCVTRRSESAVQCPPASHSTQQLRVGCVRAPGQRWVSSAATATGWDR